jgi:hypothetical protein
MRCFRYPAGMPARLLCLVVSVVCAAGTCAAQTSNREVISKARSSYYSLKRLGLIEFRANIRPNWELILKGGPASPEAMKLLNGLHFSILFGESGNVVVNHQADFPPKNDVVAKGYKDIFEGVDNAIYGFFETWNLFMFGSPFPEPDSAYELQDLGAGYLLTYAEPKNKVATTFGKDFDIKEIQVSGDSFSGAIKPQFKKTEHGQIIVAYKGSYLNAAGNLTSDLQVNIQYNEVSGLEVPLKVTVEGTYNGGPVNMEIVFSDYQIRKAGTK